MLGIIGFGSWGTALAIAASYNKKNPLNPCDKLMIISVRQVDVYLKLKYLISLN